MPREREIADDRFPEEEFRRALIYSFGARPQFTSACGLPESILYKARPLIKQYGLAAVIERMKFFGGRGYGWGAVVGYYEKEEAKKGVTKVKKLYLNCGCGGKMETIAISTATLTYCCAKCGRKATMPVGAVEVPKDQKLDREGAAFLKDTGIKNE